MIRALVRIAFVLLLFSGAVHQAHGQDETKEKPATKPDDKKSPETPLPKEQSSTTDHTARLGGQTIAYHATASTTLLKNEKDEPTAVIFSVAYTRSDVKDATQRPVAFLYNGGPGSASVWLHMGAFGPRRVLTPNAESAPPPPYRIEDNANSLLDKTDLVFIDPVGTGFSRAVGKAQGKDFWGVDPDVKSIAQFINLYVTRNGRWNSPKYLIGESYGTFRSAALSNYLQSKDGIYLNGIVLISTVLDLRSLAFNPGDDMSYIFYLPSYAATAWYHKVLEQRPVDLNGFLKGVRLYAAGDYASALMKGSMLSDADKTQVAKKLSDYTGLSEDYIKKANLRVNLQQFMAELQRSRGLTTGRLDARFSGFQTDLLAENASYDPLETATIGPFTAAFNSYARDELKFTDEHKYEVLNLDANNQWEWKHKVGDDSGFPGTPNVEVDLLQA
jgi:carboxypeptidase C (cathepsin A)